MTAISLLYRPNAFYNPHTIIVFTRYKDVSRHQELIVIYIVLLIVKLNSRSVAKFNV